MPKKKNEDDYDIKEEDLAKIGDWTQDRKKPLKPDKEEFDENRKEEPAPEGEQQEEPHPEPEKPISDFKKEELKEKICGLIARTASSGLEGKEKEDFEKTFLVWNEGLFEILGMADKISTLKVPNITPMQGILLYGGLSVGLVIALRKDLRDKLFKPKPEEDNKK